MPPQKRGRNSDKREPVEEDSEMSAPATAAAAAASDSDDSDSDDDDELTIGPREDNDDDDDDDDDEDDEMDGSDGNNDDGRVVNVEFVFNDPREEHFHSVKQFLVSYLPPSQPFDASGLANLVVSQVAAGTMVCAEGETDVYGFITGLSLARYKEENCIQQVLRYLTKRCPSTQAAELQEILQNRSVALVLNERMMNLPYQLVPVLHSALHEDTEWAIENEATPELRKLYDVEYFLVLSNCTVEKAAPAKKGKKAKTEYVATTAKFFANFEDEFLEPEAELTFSFETPRGERERVDQRSSKHSVVMLIKRARHKAALASISAMINM